MSRATKTELRDTIRDLTATLAVLKDAVSADDGREAVKALQIFENASDDLRELLEDRYDEAFDEIEGPVVDEVEEAEEVEDE